MCYVGWPYMVEAVVVAIADGKASIALEANGSRGKPVDMSIHETKQWKEDVTAITRK